MNSNTNWKWIHQIVSVSFILAWANKLKIINYSTTIYWSMHWWSNKELIQLCFCGIQIYYGTLLIIHPFTLSQGIQIVVAKWIIFLGESIWSKYLSVRLIEREVQETNYQTIPANHHSNPFTSCNWSELTEFQNRSPHYASTIKTIMQSQLKGINNHQRSIMNCHNTSKNRISCSRRLTSAWTRCFPRVSDSSKDCSLINGEASVSPVCTSIITIGTNEP